MPAFFQLSTSAQSMGEINSGFAAPADELLFDLREIVKVVQPLPVTRPYLFAGRFHDSTKSSVDDLAEDEEARERCGHGEQYESGEREARLFAPRRRELLSS